ncbi:MAG: hypothetical protein ACC612_10635 [Methanomethylovorans sp.]|uniref:hypothetical protein n=1 Tax=Methanomethylovorans sp. TaxID=2758717 RepID=UPI0035314FD1
MKGNEFVKHISNVAYGSTLKVVSRINSVNCKEWEAEKQLFEGNSKLLKSQKAVRFYVEDKNPSYNLHHYHIGHIDFRPKMESICDAYLPVPPQNNFYVTCKKSFKSDDPFNPTILTVPYKTPNPKLSLCSPPTIWILLRILSSELSKEYISMREILDSLPQGSTLSPISSDSYRDLCIKHKLSPYFYIGTRMKKFYETIEKEIESRNNDYLLQSLYDSLRNYSGDSESFIMNSDLLYSYIESEIPVFLTFKAEDLGEELNYNGEPVDEYHSVVAIGHTLDDNGNVPEFIIHDVSYSPFVKISRNFIDEKLVDAMVVLPEDIMIRFEHLMSHNFSSELFGKIVKQILPLFSSEEIDILFSSGKIQIRPFLMSSQRIKFWFTNKYIYENDVCDLYSKADFPKYVWFFELRNPELSDNYKCSGHFVFDATMDSSFKSLVLVNLPTFRLWYRNGRIYSRSFDEPSFSSLKIFRSP